MPLTKEKKQERVREVADVTKTSSSVVFVNFHGLSVSEVTELRSQMCQKGLGYKVVKKNLLKRALAEDPPEGELPSLDGECAIAYGDDLIAPAREIHQFRKTHPNNIFIMGGIFDGRYMTREEMEEVATIPPREVLIGQFVNLINSPIQQLVTGLDRIAEKKTA